MAARSVYERLLEAMQEAELGAALDHPAEVLGRYSEAGPSVGASVDAWRSVAPTASSVPGYDPNFRQLVRRTSTAGAQAADESNVRSEEPEDIWMTQQSNTGPAGAYDIKSTSPWWALPPVPAWAVLGGRFGRGLGGLGPTMLPPGATGFAKIPMPEIPKALKVQTLGLGFLALPRLLQELLLGEGVENVTQNYPQVRAPEFPQAEAQQRRSPPLYSRTTPGLAEEDDSGCAEEREEAHKACTQAIANGWRGDWGLGPNKNPRTKKLWTIEDCVRGRVSERCGGNPYDRPDGRPKKRRYKLSALSPADSVG